MSDTPKGYSAGYALDGTETRKDIEWMAREQKKDRQAYHKEFSDRGRRIKELEKKLAAANEECAALRASAQSNLESYLEQGGELAAARERVAYLESITTGAEHKAIDSAIASLAPDPSPDAQ